MLCVPIILLIIGLCIIIPLGVEQYNSENLKDRKEFEDVARTYTGFVSRTVLGSILNAGSSMKDLYTLNPDMSRDQHLQFGENIINRFVHVDILGFSKRIFDSQRISEEQEASIYFGKNLSITDPGGAFAPFREVYYPTTIQYPLTNTTRVMVDRTLTKFFYVLQKGLISGKDCISNLLFFPFSGGQAHVIYYPIYNTSSYTEDQRIQNYVGSVGSVFDLKTTLLDRIRNVATRQAGFFVFDNRNNEFIAGVCGNTGEWVGCTPGIVQILDVISTNISVVDASWRVEVVKLGDFAEFNYYLVFAIGLPITFLVVIILFILISSAQKRIDFTNSLREIEKKNKETEKQFTHYIFHEIRIPFQTIRLGLTNLRHYLPDNQTAYNTWGAIDSSINHATRILNDMLDFGKMEKGLFKLNQEYTNLYTSTNLLLSSYESSIGDKQIQFKVYIHPDIENHQFYCDVGRVNQCINNYMSNAKKFTQQGCIEFRMDIVDRIVSNPEVWTIKVSVKDSGIGISKDDQSKLFKAYQQIDNKIHEIGTGLGLTIVKNIVTLHQGEVGCNSEEGFGSEFWFTLPLQVSLKNSDSNSIQEEDSSIPSEILGCTILIVDDNENNCVSFGEYLKNRGFKNVDYAYNGAHALDKIEKNGLYDIIFLDYNMPNMNGDECAREIRKRYNLETKPYISMITGAYIDVQMLYEAGVNKVLQKPLDLNKLNQTMKEIGKCKRESETQLSQKSSDKDKEEEE